MLQAIAFAEIGAMQRLGKLQGVGSGVCKLQDYGIDKQGIYLVMTRYTCSLRGWLAKQEAAPSLRLKLYLAIFCQLAELLQVVQMQSPGWLKLSCLFVQFLEVCYAAECTDLLWLPDPA